MTQDTSLTFGQLSTWRSIETFAADRLGEVNVPATWDVRGYDTATVLHALDQLVARYESLRTTFHVVDGLPVQRVHEAGTPRVTQVHGTATGPEHATARTLALAARAFPVLDDVGWHAELGLHDGRPEYLALSLSHMVVDVWAVTELERQFRAAADGAGLDAGPAAAARELAALQRDERWAARRRGAEKYWRRLLSEGPVRNLPVPPERAEQRRIQTTLRSPALAVLTAQAAGRHAVSPQSVLMALTATALGQVLGRRGVMLSLMSANRFDPQWQSIVSTQNQLVPLVCDLDPEATLERFLKRTHLSALMAYRHGSYDVDAAAGWIDATPSPGGADFTHDCWFNYVPEAPRVDAPEAAPPAAGASAQEQAAYGRALLAQAPPAQCTWTPPRRQAGHPFYARVNSDGRTWVELSLRVDPDLIGAAEVLTMLRSITLGVLCSVQAPQTSLAALQRQYADPAAVAPAALFPAGDLTAEAIVGAE